MWPHEDLVPLGMAAVSALAVAVNSIILAGAIHKKEISPSQGTVLSLLPAFAIAVLLLPWAAEIPSIGIVLLLVFKNALYGYCLFARFRGFHEIGPIGGILAAGVQPFVLAIFNALIFGNRATVFSWFLICVSSGVLFFPLVKKIPSLRLILRHALFPAATMAVVSMMDKRAIVMGLGPADFFLWDKVLLLPTVLISMKWAGALKGLRAEVLPLLKKRSSYWVVLAGGGAWALSSFSYGYALLISSIELVPAIRNLSFPLAAAWKKISLEWPHTKQRLYRQRRPRPDTFLET